MNLRDTLSSIINEELPTLKFKYTRAQHDPKPRVKALDLEYPGRKGQKTFGKRKDLLGWNLNYFKNSRYAAKAIDQIDKVANEQGLDKKQKYEKVKELFPEQSKYLRRYMKNHIENLKQKKGWLWRKTKYDDIK